MSRTAVAWTVEPLLTTRSDWKSTSAGWGHALAIKTDGTLWAWGRNAYGALGDGTNVDKDIPVQIGTATWIQVSAGWGRTHAIKSDGTVWAWGNNINGELGDGTYVHKNAPVQIGNATWTQVSTGINHSLAIKTDGTLWAWGDSTYGFGNTPIPIGTATDWVQASAGGYHSISGELSQAIDRVVMALVDFDKHTGQIHPRFAYGTLTKAQYQCARSAHRGSLTRCSCELMNCKTHTVIDNPNTGAP